MRSLGIRLFLVLFILLLGLVFATFQSVQPIPASFLRFDQQELRAQVVDRRGSPLALTYHNRWNFGSQIALHEVPSFLQQAFIFCEDRRFFKHSGIDWWARLHALVQNILARRVVRGASTIPEQVIRIIRPRKRKIWSRWIEGFEAKKLSKHFSKAEILEFYLNQVPYAARRRGIVQAASYYFDRDLETLSKKEMLALAVLVRAPSRLDPYKDPSKLNKRVEFIAKDMLSRKLLSAGEYKEIVKLPLELKKPSLRENAAHFVQYIRSQDNLQRHIQNGKLVATIDSNLQARFRQMLETRIEVLKDRNVSDGALLVVDHQNDEVIAWVNAGEFSLEQGSQIDAVTSPRQPGSTLKPFVYALALSKGWTAASIVDDLPLSQAVSMGLHDYRNYSRSYYGPLRIRLALGNSLNIPAIRAANFVGEHEILKLLKRLNFSSLTKGADYYGAGIALGNAEVSLFELVAAYATLARAGVYRPLQFVPGNFRPKESTRIFSTEVASLISNILSDPEARQLEFGRGSLLRFPVQTAVKTGTSTAFRDAWALGFSSRYTAGVWMGNMNREPMQNISGSIGPALVLRAIFSELNRDADTKELYLSPKLSAINICSFSGKRALKSCPQVRDWFRAEHIPENYCNAVHGVVELKETFSDHDKPYISRPTPRLNLALDPRIPDDLEAFSFELSFPAEIQRIDWILNERLIGRSNNGSKSFIWPLKKRAAFP